jgi:hypothetical protein
MLPHVTGVFPQVLPQPMSWWLVAVAVLVITVAVAVLVVAFITKQLLLSPEICR